MPIYYATTNKGKVNSLRKTLEKHNIEVEQVPFEMPEPRSDNLELIAKEKVLYAFEKLQKPIVALDAGFFIYSLNGFPRAFVNFALETIGIEGILNLVKGKERGCEFRHCLGYLDESLKEPIFFSSSTKGELTKKPIGEMQSHLWSKLTTIFIPENSKKTLAEMTYEEYLIWREKNKDNSYAEKFAEWYIKNRNKNL